VDNFHGLKSWLIWFDSKTHGFTALLIPALRGKMPLDNGFPVRALPENQTVRLAKMALGTSRPQS
jgi:hypothetical protein